MPRGNFLSTNQKHYQELGSARHQYGISALVSQTSFCEGSTGDLAKRRLFSQASLELQQRIASLETQLADCQEKLSVAGKENKILLTHQFSLDKIMDDNATILFYTGFPSYKTSMSFYKYLVPNFPKCSTGWVKTWSRKASLFK